MARASRRKKGIPCALLFPWPGGSWGLCLMRDRGVRRTRLRRSRCLISRSRNWNGFWGMRWRGKARGGRWLRCSAGGSGRGVRRFKGVQRLHRLLSSERLVLPESLKAHTFSTAAVRTRARAISWGSPLSRCRSISKMKSTMSRCISGRISRRSSRGRCGGRCRRSWRGRLSATDERRTGSL